MDEEKQQEEKEKDKEEKEPELTSYYLLQDWQGGKMFIQQHELDMYFDVIKEKGSYTPTARVNLRKDHGCCKEDGERCSCMRFDSWLCNRELNSAKSTLPFGTGKFSKPIILLGIMNFSWQ